jgi:two-component system, OmpR family, alkaline phosphatase synthesis response regulator PhoP
MSRTALVVEDEPDILLAVRVVLEAAGYAVIEANGGKQALELADEPNLDAILLDLRMPDLDGWAVLEVLRAKGTSSRVPVIILSAHGSPSTVERSVELGARGYVKKPFRAADLTRALEAVLA